MFWNQKKFRTNMSADAFNVCADHLMSNLEEKMSEVQKEKVLIIEEREKRQCTQIIY